MAAVPSELMVFVVMALLAVPAATYGTAAFDGPDAAAPAPQPDTTAPPTLPESPDPEALTFKGRIVVGDPSGEAFGPEGALWEESCATFDFVPAGHTNTTLNLTGSPTDGRTEDLDLWFWDADGELLDQLEGPSSGIGTHHAGLIPGATAAFSVCLAEGAQGRFLVEMT